MSGRCPTGDRPDPLFGHSPSPAGVHPAPPPRKRPRRCLLERPDTARKWGCTRWMKDPSPIAPRVCRALGETPVSVID
jgi:hypothetical protein